MITRKRFKKQEKVLNLEQKVRELSKKQLCVVNYIMIASSYLTQMIFPHKYIADQAGVSVSTVKRAIDEFCSWGKFRKTNRLFPSKIVDGINYQSTNLYEVLMNLKERYEVYKILGICFISISQVISSPVAINQKFELPIIFKGIKSYIFSHGVSVSNNSTSPDYQLLAKEHRKMNEERYEDQPWFDKELRIQKEKRKQEYLDNKNLTLREKSQSEDFHKREAYIPFVPHDPKTEEYMATQRNEFANLLTKPSIKLDEKASEFACILLRGFNRD